MSGQYGPGSEEQSDRLIGVRSLCHPVCTICAKRVVVFHFIRENTRVFLLWTIYHRVVSPTLHCGFSFYRE